MAAALLAVSLLVAGPAQAAPLTSTLEDPFTSVDIGGEIDEGRYSESYAGGGALQAGNVLDVLSYDGVNPLGDQWYLSNSVAVDVDDRGIIDPLALDPLHWYVVTYAGDDVVMRLGDTGPWWNPTDPGTEYDVDVTLHRHDVKVGTVSQTVTATMLVQGTFTDPAFSNYTVDIMLATARQVGEGPQPDPDYPEYLPEDYTDDGQWGRVEQIQVTITPEPTTLGLVGLGGMLTLMRRRRRARRLA